MIFNHFSVFLGILLVAGINSQQVYKVCSGDGTIESCLQLSRGKTQVNCVWVQDSIECAKSIQNGTADFGMFSADSMMQLAILGWENLAVIQPFANKERASAATDYQSVVVVRSSHQNGINGLAGKKYCHPGFDYNPNEKWSERAFKQFERKVATPKCEKYKSPAEIEASTLSQFFGDSCRPGIWSHDHKEDAELKKKFPSLCKLCPTGCKYSAKPQIERNHEFALTCLKNGGDVAYVSLQESQKFFNTTTDINVDDYAYLCQDGSVVPIKNNPQPCSWLSQPWKAIISRSDGYYEKTLQTELSKWMEKGLDGISWESHLRNILKVEDFKRISNPKIETPKEYVARFREIPLDETYCNSVISWCTTSKAEESKCNVARAAGIAVGLYPQIKCRSPVHSTVQCLEDISRNDTDFMGIDSNYGWLARANFNLSSVLFFDTEVDQFSSIVIAVKDNSMIKNFSELRGKKACLPEYGSSPAVALVNELKNRKIFDKDDCNYGGMLKEFLADSCMPGADDFKYLMTNDTSFTSLCTLCFQGSGNSNGNNNGEFNSDIDSPNSDTEVGRPINRWINATIATCSADISNRYFGNRGALKCLNEAGDFAVLELQSLKQHAEQVEIAEDRFKILCRNNSLSKETGFDVDLNCALTTVVDGEIIMYRKSPKTSSVVHVLLGLEHYLIRKNDPGFKMYNIYDTERNLLFKDSTIGLTHPESSFQGQMVENYKTLFRDVEKCSGNSATSISINILSSVFVAFFAFVLYH